MWTIRVLTTQVIPPRSQAFLPATIADPLPKSQPTLLIEPSPSLKEKYGLEFQRCIVSSKRKDIIVKVINLQDVSVKLYDHTTLGTAEAVLSPEAQLVARVNAEAASLCQMGPPNALAQRQLMEDIRVSTKIDNPNLDQSQKEKLYRLITKNIDCFSRHDYDLGPTPTICHKIITNTNVPFKQQSYRVPTSLRAAVKKQIEEMVEYGVLEPSASPYSSPVVIVEKKDGRPKVLW